MEALGWQRCTLLGHSRGAAISMLFAATFPERVDKLVQIIAASKGRRLEELDRTVELVEGWLANNRKKAG